MAALYKDARGKTIGCFAERNNRLFYYDNKKNIFHNQKLPFKLMKMQYAIFSYLCTENPNRFTQKEDFEMFIWSQGTLT